MSKRNVSRRTNFRPALPRRAIVWFPEFDALVSKRIMRFRAEHDPLASTITPHLSLVFPFAANLTATQLESHIKRSTRGWPLVPITFRGIETVGGQFVVLAADLRKEALVEMHDRLYRGPLSQFLRSDIDFNAHITLGRANDAVPVEAMLAEAELCFRESAASTLRQLSIVRYGEDGTIEIEKHVPLLLA